jgi:hypothetical protein
MHFPKIHQNIFSALLVTAMLTLIAGVARAILDADVDIKPDSPGYDGSAGYVDASGTSYSSAVAVYCTDADNDFHIYCETDHPDKVSLSNAQGQVSQTKKGNNATAAIDVDRMGGIDVDAEFLLSCEKVQVKGKSNDSTERAEVQCMLKGCEIPGALTINQIRSAIDCIDGSVASGDIGKKVQKLRVGNDNRIQGKIKSKGDWL